MVKEIETWDLWRSQNANKNVAFLG